MQFDDSRGGVSRLTSGVASPASGRRSPPRPRENIPLYIRGVCCTAAPGSVDWVDWVDWVDCENASEFLTRTFLFSCAAVAERGAG
jgi:hypothetical protein